MKNNYSFLPMDKYSIGHLLQKATKKYCLVLAFLFVGALTLKAQFPPLKFYYLRTDSVRRGVQVKPPVNSLLAWTDDSTGKKGNTPSDFTTPGQAFQIQTNGFSNNRGWALGNFCALVIGARDSTIVFNSGANLNIDAANVAVLANATFNYQGPSTDSLSFVRLDSASTVRYGGSTLASQKVLKANYYNLNINVAANNIPVTLPRDTVSVAGSLTRSNNLVLNGSTINFNGKGGQTITSGNYYNLNISGLKTISDTLRSPNIAGSLTNNSIGAPLKLYNTIAGVSNINYNGLIPQTINNLTFNNLTFFNGRPFNISSYDSASNSLTLVGAGDPDLAVGQKIANVVATNPLVADTSIAITAITNDTVLTLSKPLLLKAYVNHAGHLPGAAPDTIYITSYSAATRSFNVTTTPVVNVNDTIVGLIFGNRTRATVVNGNTITVSAALINTNNLGSLSFGSPTLKPSDKSIFGTDYIYGALTVNAANVTTTGSSINFDGIRQTIPGLTYNNLYIAQDSFSTARLTGPAFVKGNFSIAGKLRTTTVNLLTLDTSATYFTPTNDTFFVAGPLSKNFASTKPFTYYIGGIVNGAADSRKITITPKTPETKTYLGAWVNAVAPNYTALDTTNVASIDSTSYYAVAVYKYNAGADTTAKINFQYKNLMGSGPVLLKEVNNVWGISGSNAIPDTTLPNSGWITTDSFTTGGFFAFGLQKPVVTPVSLLSFTGHNIGTGNVLQWTTTTEKNIAYYVVERSTTPNGLYSSVATVGAKGNYSLANNVYSYTDNKLSKDVNTYYYRVVAFDVNGKQAYTQVLSIKSSAILSLSVGIYPNPVESKLNLAVATPNDSKVIFQISDVNGRTMKALQTNILSGQNALSFDVSSLQSGVYHLTSISENGEKTTTTFYKK